MSIRHSQALLWQTVDFQPVFLPACTRLLFPFAGNPFSSLYYMFFVGFSEILRRWKAAGKFLTLMAFARVLSIYFPTVSAWYKKTIGTKLRWNGFELKVHECPQYSPKVSITLKRSGMRCSLGLVTRFQVHETLCTWLEIAWWLDSA